MSVTDAMHEGVVAITGVLIALFELFGALIILYIGIITVYKFFRLRFGQTSTELRVRFGRAIALGLLFYLAAEVFRLITVREYQDLAIVGVIIVLHVIISLLIAWEVEHGLKTVKQEQEMDLQSGHATTGHATKR